MAAYKILWLTSFNKQLYDVSGSLLIKSFLHTKTDGDLLCCYEDMPTFMPDAGNILIHDLANSPWLNEWLLKNQDIIPNDLGGKASHCQCPDRDPHAKTHKACCVGQWFNRHASRWFRKIVSLDYAVNNFEGYDVIVWIDADCVFEKKVTEALVLEWFCGCAVFYLKTRKRKAPETGLVGYHLGRGGKDFIEELCNRYRTGIFRKDKRWDDGYQVGMVVKQNLVNTVDIACAVSGHSDVLPHSPAGRFIRHFKGKHSRVLGIMK